MGKIITLEAYHDEEVTRIQSIARDYTIPIYEMKNGEPDLDGSGVLLMIDSRYFLITAAHVIDKTLRNPNSAVFSVPAGKSFSAIEGEALFTEPPGGDRILDKSDIAIVCLSDEYFETLKDAGHNFLTMDQIDTRHFAVPHHHYFFLGYPATKTKKIHGTKTIRSQATTYLSNIIPSSEVARNYPAEFHGDSHIIVRYKNDEVKMMSGVQATLPDLHGISGCGMWHFIATPPNYTLKLIGVIIEGRRGKHSREVISTRIHIALQMVLNRFPELSSLVRL